MRPIRRTVLRPAVLAIAALGIATAARAARPGIWLNVPFVHQQANGCGSACISMVMQYWLGRDGGQIPAAAEEPQIQRALYDSTARGVYASDMERYFRHNGFSAFAFAGTLDDLGHHLSRGRPLIVCLADRGARGPLHYVVVVGIDRPQKVLMVNDPAQRKLLKMDISEFEKRWNTMHDWTLLAVPQK